MTEPKPARRSHSAGDRIFVQARQPLTVSRSLIAIVVTPAPLSVGLRSRLVRLRSGTGSQDLREGANGHRDTQAEDHEGADRGQRADGAALETHTAECASGPDRDQSDA